MGDDIDTAFFQDVTGLIEKAHVINKKLVSFIEPQVNEIIRNCDTDRVRIEVLLDQLLDCAGMDNGALGLFKHLCRYYYRLNPIIVTEYVYTYRDLYDCIEYSPNDDDDTL